MKLSEFDYELLPELIAQDPLPERDASRLLHVLPEAGVEHLFFAALPDLLEPGDVLVVNDTKVFPARLTGTRASGGRVGLLLLEDLGEGCWRVLGKPARKLRVGAELTFGAGRLVAEVVGTESDPLVVRFEHDGAFADIIDALGTTPLPPYIRSSESEPATRDRYQTVYATDRGSIAAPTAGLHFTQDILKRLVERGIDVARLTLHVGYGTFEPIRTDIVEEHAMGVERFHVPRETAELVGSGRTVIAVGTTSVRALESAARIDFAPGWHETDLFITPGFEFRAVRGLVTNFHLPKSSLLLLVSAFGGTARVRAAYREAVKERYRFYSYGDCMLLPPARL